MNIRGDRRGPAICRRDRFSLPPQWILRNRCIYAITSTDPTTTHHLPYTTSIAAIHSAFVQQFSRKVYQQHNTPPPFTSFNHLSNRSHPTLARRRFPRSIEAHSVGRIEPDPTTVQARATPAVTVSRPLPTAKRMNRAHHFLALPFPTLMVARRSARRYRAILRRLL